MFHKIGSLAVRFKFWIIAAWVAAAVLMFLFAPSLSEVGSMKETDFLPKDSESLHASELLVKYFPENIAASTVSLIYFDPDKISEYDLSYARQVKDWLDSGQTSFEVTGVTSVFDSEQLEASLLSPDGTTMLMSVGLEQPAFDSRSIATTEKIRDHLASAPEGLEIYVSGQVGIYGDMFDALNRSIDLTTLVTVILVIVLLVVIYRSPIAALVPLVTIGIAFLVARGTVGLVGQAGLSIWSQLDVFLIVLIFGIGTDYCLFLISRFREELGRHESRIEAMKTTVSKIGAVITASAFAVIVGLSGMFVARYQMIKTMGPMMGLAIFITLLAALTLAPAMASIFGRKLFWPRHGELRKDREMKQSRFWTKIAGFSTGRPVIVGGLLIILLLLPYLALPQLHRSFDQLAEIPPDAESVAGFRIMEDHYDIGEIDPLTAVIVAPEGKKLTDPDTLTALSKISTDLSAVPGVVKVQSAVQPEGAGQTPPGFTVSGQLTTIGEGLTSSFSGSSVDPSALLNPELGTSLTNTNSYLGELSRNFDWVKVESSYQALPADLQVIGQAIEDIKAGAQVENQLRDLSVQISNTSQALANSGAALTPEAINLITALKGYLDDLAGQYPDVQNEPSYHIAYTITSNIGQVLMSSQPPAMLPPELQKVVSSLPDYLRQLADSLEGLAKTFQGKNALLVSSSLASISAGTSPMETLQSLFGILKTDLDTLSARFVQEGNPLFFSSTLLSSSPEGEGLLDLFFDLDRRATRFYIVLDTYPQSEKALNTAASVRESLKSGISGTALDQADAAIGGTSAVLSDVRRTLDNDFNIIMLVVIGAIFVVLVMLLKSLIAPVYLLMTVLLSYGTTLGIISWIFQEILGQDGTSFMIPIVLFVLLVALGSDYNIFLMSRVREESATRITREGARLAAIVTGGVITACGIILAGTFATLVITPINSMIQLGSAVAIGVFIDTFLVRALLVPAIASLLGRWNWWPGKHSK